MIVFINLYGWPDCAATAQLLGDVLRARDVALDVMVVQGDARYSTAMSSDGDPGVPVVRMWTPPVMRRTPVLRAVGFAVFYLQVTWFLLCRPRASSIVVMTSPPFLNWLGALSKIIRGGRMIAWEMDVYPEILFSAGVVSRRGVSGCILQAVTRWARRKTDLTIVLGPCMRRLFESSTRSRVAELHNWSDGRRLFPTRAAGSGEGLVVLYSGNLGVAHDVDTVMVAIGRLKLSRLQFVFSGGGAKMRRLRGMQAPNVQFREACELSALNTVLNEADIGLVTQTEESLGCVVPSKVYGLLAAGRAVLYVGPAESTIAEIIRDSGCGWTVGVGCVDELVGLLEHLQVHRGEVENAGRRARIVFEQRYTREAGVGQCWRLVSGVLCR